MLNAKFQLPVAHRSLHLPSLIFPGNPAAPATAGVDATLTTTAPSAQKGPTLPVQSGPEAGGFQALFATAAGSMAAEDHGGPGGAGMAGPRKLKAEACQKKTPGDSTTAKNEGSAAGIVMALLGQTPCAPASLATAETCTEGSVAFAPASERNAGDVNFSAGVTLRKGMAESPAERTTVSVWPQASGSNNLDCPPGASAINGPFTGAGPGEQGRTASVPDAAAESASSPERWTRAAEGRLDFAAPAGGRKFVNLAGTGSGAHLQAPPRCSTLRLTESSRRGRRLRSALRQGRQFRLHRRLWLNSQQRLRRQQTVRSQIYRVKLWRRSPARRTEA